MDFNEYQDRSSLFAIYPEAGTGSVMALAYLGLGLGEAGEVQDKLKKVLRDNDGHVSAETRHALAGELGDTLWYLAALARELGIPLEQIAERNIEKLQSRADRGVLGGSGDER